jgi:hypothetical protein
MVEGEVVKRNSPKITFGLSHHQKLKAICEVRKLDN